MGYCRTSLPGRKRPRGVSRRRHSSLHVPREVSRAQNQPCSPQQPARSSNPMRDACDTADELGNAQNPWVRSAPLHAEREGYYAEVRIPHSRPLFWQADRLRSNMVIIWALGNEVTATCFEWKEQRGQQSPVGGRSGRPASLRASRPTLRRFPLDSKQCGTIEPGEHPQTTRKTTEGTEQQVLTPFSFPDPFFFPVGL